MHQISSLYSWTMWKKNTAATGGHCITVVGRMQAFTKSFKKTVEMWCWLTALITKRMGTVAWVLLSSLRGRDLALPPGRSPKSKYPDLLASTWEAKWIKRLNLRGTTLFLFTSGLEEEALTSSAGFSAMATSTTLLAKILARAATSVSAEAGQEQTERTHW